MKKDFICWLRWVAVLPGALIAGLLSTFPLHWILYFLFNEKETDLGSVKFFIQLFGRGISYKDIEYTLSPFVIAITFILVGFEIAPKYKFKTSIILTILYVSSFLVLVFIIAPRHQYQLEARGILALLGSLLGLYITWRKSRLTPPIAPSNNKGFKNE